MAEARASETPEQREATVEENRLRMAEARAAETSEQREMASFGTTTTTQDTGFMPTFKVKGQIYHRSPAAPSQ
ncbi:hypothetical protein ANCCEY_08922 [Ancylostoma ceylanicum]|uniref:Uncharacterized protein n=1 Tax=Ancylostoma ceylanicum TaxID=53326 RepID=A0A0D6LLD7_9BILA|nr:hypothetical protein ANCCEY_08922 [Ancylostoma ceylanicum]